MDIVVWTLAILLLLIGFVGTVLPVLPGTTLMLVAVLLQKWLLPHTLTWALVGWIAVFWFLSVLADVLSTLLGTRLFGGTKWGMAGATGGALVGMFFSIPALLLGTVMGAVLAEKWGAKRSTGASVKAGAGAAVGFVIGTVAKVGCALVILAFYGIAIYTALKPALGT